MKPEDRKIIDEFRARADGMSDDILAETEEWLGTVPFIFKLMRERPESFAFSVLGDYHTARPPHLDAKTAELVAIAAAAGAGADKCVKVHVGAALKEGATRDEILDTILIAGVMGKTRILAPALRAFQDSF
ncbi:carboxymuconolactone decarboxylase family protein [Methanofollis fontis]|uniref:Alkylhydroperoxidase n=1 Tax=Methanofollis fontis TaxID=2052832 RepID=A0A483CUM5_9EURY|nr:carboxymuconolactone decarboxylase family protein [Methanofollis fontis]TAJ45028.1 alkylhydroperoxidase [Methanofollis fontis]